LAALLLLLAIAARADERSIAIHGFVDGYYAWNSNHPDNHQNFIPGTGTTAVHADEIALNVAAIEFVRDPKPLGFHVTLVGGDAANVVHAGEPKRYRNIYQASVSYAKDKLSLEGGVYPSHIGFEGFFSKDNWNYTRGWLGELTPYYQAGVKAAYAWSDRWSGQLHVLQGWQLIHDNNRGRSVGTQIAYSDNRLSASLNTLIGPELANDNSHMRLFGDLVATYKATPKLTVAGSLDRGRQALPGAAYANWLGASAWGRYAINDRHAIAVRLDRLRDPDNGISGFAQTLSSATLTYEFDPTKNLILKVDARRDHSTQPVFAGRENESLLILGVVARF
jgi:hypothetical protein